MLQNIKNAIASRGLPFPVHATEGPPGFVILTVCMRHFGDDRLTGAESIAMRTPTDAVTLVGLDRAIRRITHFANAAQHQGLELF